MSSGTWWKDPKEYQHLMKMWDTLGLLTVTQYPTYIGDPDMIQTRNFLIWISPACWGH